MKQTNSRFKKIVFSSVTSTLLKLITFLCSFILTRLIIGNYGSEINGIISSITQFLGFIALLEGGIGGIARAVLYKPLAKKNDEEIQKIISYIERFFRILALIFVAYSIAIACIFPIFSDKEYLFTFTLVLIMAISSFCEYFFGMSYTILLASDQKTHVINYLSGIVTIINFIISFVLIRIGAQIHIVKLISVFILISKPLFLSFYCRKKYNLKRTKLKKNDNVLPQKWSGLGVHVAYYLHRNTDIFLITIFLSLTTVSVYSVYNMVISGILTFINALSVGFEAALGNMLSNNEKDNLKSKFRIYVFYYQLLCTFLLSATLVLIVPFVSIYTKGITDANYYQPLFAFLFVFAEFMYCLRVPFNDLMVATNSFKDIRWGAYFEVIINITVSVSLIFIIGLNGVVVGTICAMLFRLIHFLWFFKTKKIHIEIGWFIKNTLVSLTSLLFSFFILRYLNINSGLTYLSWIKYAIVVSVFCFIFVVLFNAILIGENLCPF